MSQAQFRLGASAASLVILALGCDAAVDPIATTVRVGASVSVAQTPLDGTTIPRFVDPLPTFNGRRVDGTATVNVNMQEFQQKVLPASIYASLAGSLQRGDVSLGLQHQRRRGLVAGAHDRGQAERRHDGDLHQQPHQHAFATVADRRSVAPLGRSPGDDGGQQLRQRSAAGNPLHPAVRRPDPHRRAPARQRGPVAVRRAPGRLVDPRVRPEGTVLRQQHLQLPEPAGGDDALVPRPHARDRASQRLRRSGRLLLHPRQPGHGPREQPDHSSVGRAGS